MTTLNANTTVAVMSRDFVRTTAVEGVEADEDATVRVNITGTNSPLSS